MATSDSALAADLVREFLEHFELHSSLAVMIPEGNPPDAFLSQLGWHLWEID